MSDPSGLAREIEDARRSPGLFSLGPGPFARGIVGVTGRDAPRWLDGMVSNDVTALSADTRANGCYAALLTPKGRIVADLHVLARPGGYWLETAGCAVQAVVERLEKYIVADDVTLMDLSGEFARMGVEGPGATRLLESAGDGSLAGLPEHAASALAVEGVELVAARFGWSGEDAWQLFVPTAGAEAVREALSAAGAAARSDAALEVLRVEAGIARLGPELGEEVFPDEARLEAAISRTKGCYTGQEIVARLHSRGAVNHLLVGLHFSSPSAGPSAGVSPPQPEAVLAAGEKRTGRVTSSCVSPHVGAVGLGYVRSEHAEPGTRLRCGDVEATVSALPLVEVGASA